MVVVGDLVAIMNAGAYGAFGEVWQIRPATAMHCWR